MALEGLPGLPPTDDQLVAVQPWYEAWSLGDAGSWATYETLGGGPAHWEAGGHDGRHALLGRDTNGDAVDDVSYTHDARNHRTSESGKHYTYDAHGRMRTASNGAVTTAYTYDAFGRRATSDTDGIGVRYVYDGLDVVEERGSDTNNLLRQYVHAGSLGAPLLIDENVDGGALATDPGDRRVYTATDILGTVTGLLDADGQLVEAYLYDAYGQPHIFGQVDGTVSWADENSLDTSAYANPYMFTGQRWDPIFDLYDYKARIYDPASGRFLTQDPIGIWGDPGNHGNPYAFVSGNPTSLVDPLGARTMSYGENFFGYTCGGGLRACLPAEEQAGWGAGLAANPVASGCSLGPFGAGMPSAADTVGPCGDACATASPGDYEACKNRQIAGQAFVALAVTAGVAGVAVIGASAAAGSAAAGSVAAGSAGGAGTAATATGLSQIIPRAVAGCGLGTSFNYVGGGGSLMDYAGSCVGGAIAMFGGQGVTFFGRVGSGFLYGLGGGALDSAITQGGNWIASGRRCDISSDALKYSMATYGIGGAVGGAFSLPGGPNLARTPWYGPDGELIYDTVTGGRFAMFGILTDGALSPNHSASCSR